jgi:hypothetical protein
MTPTFRMGSLESGYTYVPTQIFRDHATSTRGLCLSEY